jgi:hypothetical protein
MHLLQFHVTRCFEMRTPDCNLRRDVVQIQRTAYLCSFVEAPANPAPHVGSFRPSSHHAPFWLRMSEALRAAYSAAKSHPDVVYPLQ